MGHLKLPIKGMHCRSCEILLEETIKDVPHVASVSVSYAKNQADITYHTEAPSHKALERAVQDAGYEVGTNEPATWMSRHWSDYRELMIAGITLFLLYASARMFGLLDISLQTENVTYSFAFVIGLVAGISTCMAIVGGLILGISARHAELHPEATSLQKFRPHLFFNIGRIGGYAVFGGILGALGGVLKISGSFQAVLTLMVGAVMIFLGLKLTGISPKLKEISLTLPPSVSKFFGISKHQKEYRHTSAIMTGALTFFLPCGFTQAMQLAAISSGSSTSGALIMGLFALGTAPALLSIGGLTSVIKGKVARRFYAIVGLAVLLFGFFNATNGLALMGFGSATYASGVASNAAEIVNGRQIVRMTQNNSGYQPNTFTVKKGIPVKWIITSEAPYSCSASIVMPSMNIQQSLPSGENIIEFTPTQTGRLPFSCAMGMYRGSFTVVDDVTAQPTGYPVNNARALATSAPANTGSCGAGGGGCGCGGGGAKQERIAAPLGAIATDSSGTQIISSIDKRGLSPNEFTVRSGKPVEWTITPDGPLTGCYVGFYNSDLGIGVRESDPSPTVIRFTPTSPGDYAITCPMGMWRATIHVQ